jgi:hypothetical protein
MINDTVLPTLSLESKARRMLQSLIATPLFAIAILAISFAPPGSAQEGDNALCHACNSEVTTLRLFFSRDTVNAGQNPRGFMPEVAKVYVDDFYVGDAIVNLHGHVPTLRFPKSTVKLKVAMPDGRKFETKITFLGHGSTQVLFVDFSKGSPKTVPRGG